MLGLLIFFGAKAKALLLLKRLVRKERKNQLLAVSEKLERVIKNQLQKEELQVLKKLNIRKMVSRISSSQAEKLGSSVKEVKS